MRGQKEMDEAHTMVKAMQDNLRDSANENKVFMEFKVHAISELDIVKSTVKMDGTLYVFWNVSLKSLIHFTFASCPPPL
jgi:hypothetical protein